MHEITRYHRGFHVDIRIPDSIAFGLAGGSVMILSPTRDAGVRFTPNWDHVPSGREDAENLLFAYACGLIDNELAGGFGIELQAT